MKNPRMKFPGTLLTNIGILLASVACSLLLGEWAVRTWMPSPDYGVGKRPAIRNQLFIYDELLGWKGSPNASSAYISKDFIVSVSHDNLGYRNLSPAYVPGKKNILLLGDSYGWGWGVEDDETATAVFNRKHEDFNAYSLAIPGYGTDQQYLAMQRFMDQHPTFQYEQAVVLFYLNDFDDVVASLGSGMYPKPLFHLDEQGELQLQNVPVPQNQLPPVSITDMPTERPLLQRSQLFNLALDSLGKILFNLTADPDPVEVGPVTLTDTDQHSIMVAEKLLQKIRHYCQSRNMGFQVVFLMTINTDGKPTMMIQQLAGRLQQDGIAHSFVHSRLFPRTDLWLDTHYTPYGQARLADHLGEILNREP